MANVYNAANKYFDIDTDCAEAALTTLKGSGPDSNDSIYIFNSATVTLGAAGNFGVKKIYLGDNYAGTAATKTGFCTVTSAKSGYALTLYDSTVNGGLDGEGTTSKYTIIGAAGNPVTVKSNVSNTCSDANVKTAPCEYRHVTFENFLSLGCQNNQRLYEDVLIKGASSTYAWIFYTEPGKFEGCGVQDAGSGTRRVHVNSAISDVSFNYVMGNFKVVNTGAAVGGRQWAIDEPAGTSYFRFHRSAASLSEGEIYEKIFQFVQLLLAARI